MALKTDDPQATAAAGPVKMNLGEIGRVILMAAFIVGVLLLLRATPLGRQLTDRDKLSVWLSRWGHWAWAVYLLLGTALLSIGVPRLMFSWIAGAMFGFWYGVALATVVTTVSAIPPFYYTRFLGGEMVARRMGGRLQKFNALLEHHGFMVILLIRLCPAGNAFVMNCLSGLSKIRFKSYLAASSIGFLPMTVIFVVLGSSLKAGSFYLRLVCGTVLLIVFSLLFIWYFKRSTLARDVMAIMREGKKG